MENAIRGNIPSNSGMSTSKADGFLNEASTSAHTAVNSVAGAAEAAVRKAKPAIDQVAAMAHHAVDRAAEVATPTAEWLAEQGESLNVAQKKLVADTCGYVSANPLKSIGIAVAAGFLLSRMIR